MLSLSLGEETRREIIIKCEFLVNCQICVNFWPILKNLHNHKRRNDFKNGLFELQRNKGLDDLLKFFEEFWDLKGHF